MDRAQLTVPSASDRRRLTEASLGVSDTSIARTYANPDAVRVVTWLRIQRAALELGLPLPGAQQT